MKGIQAYLNFKGQCEEAFSFYEKCFGGKIAFMETYGKSPMKDQVPANWQGKVMHATLMVRDQAIMACDPPPDRFETPRGFSLALSFDSSADGERVFKELASGGQITMPFQKTFWSSGFGMVTDRFGIPWMVNCEEGVVHQ
jgi:PhnB protein